MPYHPVHVFPYLSSSTYTVKTKVFTAHHFVPIHTLFLFLVCVLGQFSVQYTLSFLQCNVTSKALVVYLQSFSTCIFILARSIFPLLGHERSHLLS